MTGSRDLVVQDARLWGASVRCTDGTVVHFVAPPDVEDDGDGGVREPRRPKPTTPARARRQA